MAGVCSAEMGHNVICVDVDDKKVALMQSGVSQIHEADLEDLMVKNYAADRLYSTTDYASAYRDANMLSLLVFLHLSALTVLQIWNILRQLPAK